MKKSHEANFLKYFLYTLGVIVLLFYIIVPIGSAIQVLSSDAYDVATDFIKNDSIVISKVGKVKEFETLPHGRIGHGTYKKDAQIETEVTGDKGTVEIILIMETNDKMDWVVQKLYIDKVIYRDYETE